MEFPPFRIDREQGRLWRGDAPVPLRPKAWEVLIYLTGRPGELVTKDALLNAVWHDTAVQEAVITNCVYELRRALADDRRAPRFIEVVHRRGFRWIATAGPKSATSAQSTSPVPAVGAASSDSFVGRETELEHLQSSWKAAAAGQRRVVFVAGEPGIGKTTLVNQFLAEDQLAIALDDQRFGVGVEAGCGHRCLYHAAIAEPAIESAVAVVAESGEVVFLPCRVEAVG